MAKRIFVTATNTNIGKTFTTKKLIEALSGLGYLVGVLKPIETGVVDGIAEDAYELLACAKRYNPNLWHVELEDVVPITFELPAAPYVSAHAKIIDKEPIYRALHKMEALCDVLLIEGAGGLYVPIGLEFMMIDLICELQATALLVTHTSLGCINDTLLSKRALETYGIKHLIAFNQKEHTDSFATVSKPYFEDANMEVSLVDGDIEKIAQLLYNL